MGGAPAKSRYAAGDRVDHPKFGVGVVQRIDAAGEDNKLVISFDSVGEKVLMERFAKLNKL
jgi:DNA helicase-2/ATP-dependent DNA helicase PcrA